MYVSLKNERIREYKLIIRLIRILSAGDMIGCNYQGLFYLFYFIYLFIYF